MIMIDYLELCRMIIGASYAGESQERGEEN